MQRRGFIQTVIGAFVATKTAHGTVTVHPEAPADVPPASPPPQHVRDVPREGADRFFTWLRVDGRPFRVTRITGSQYRRWGTLGLEMAGPTFTLYLPTDERPTREFFVRAMREKREVKVKVDMPGRKEEWVFAGFVTAYMELNAHQAEVTVRLPPVAVGHVVAVD